jgi:AraC-like DNA-binding protein
MLIQIRNMESNRCIATVKNELNKLGFQYKRVALGEVELKEKISAEKLLLIDNALRTAGLELMRDKNSRLVEKIKFSINQLINLPEDLPKSNISNFISKNINLDYAYLSNIFSRIQGVSIEKYIITQKIERVKELLVYGKLSLVDIAFKLHYSSVAHLSNQFKKVTGLTPSFFKLLRKKKHIRS